eukprot:7382364-Prymnesium_polylepis.1
MQDAAGVAPVAAVAAVAHDEENPSSLGRAESMVAAGFEQALHYLEVEAQVHSVPTREKVDEHGHLNAAHVARLFHNVKRPVLTRFFLALCGLMVAAGLAVFLPMSLMQHDVDWFQEDETLRAVAISHLAAIPMFTTVLQHSSHRRHVSKSEVVDMLVIVSLLQMKRAAKAAVLSGFAALLVEYLDILIAFAAALSFSRALEVAQDVVDAIAAKQDDAVHKCKPVAKWRGLMENFTCWRNAEKDGVYTFRNAPSAALTLTHVTSMYLIIAKATIALLFVLFAAGVDVYENIVW